MLYSEEENMYSKSAYNLLKEEEIQTPIVTFSAAFDNMIGGGIPIGKITEICGAPGLGKTQFGDHMDMDVEELEPSHSTSNPIPENKSPKDHFLWDTHKKIFACDQIGRMQIAVAAQIPIAFGGIGGEALYIDTEGSFITERVLEIAEAASKHIQDISVGETDLCSAACGFTTDSIMNGIHVGQCHSYNELVAMSYILSDIILKHPKVKVVIVDSIAFHFRHEFEDMGLRTRLLHTLAQNFMKAAYDYKLAIVFMNQMTTKLTESNPSKLVPALGQSWSHVCTNRIILNSMDGKKYAHLIKSPNYQEATAPYEVTKDGVRDAQT